MPVQEEQQSKLFADARARSLTASAIMQSGELAPPATLSAAMPSSVGTAAAPVAKRNEEARDPRQSMDVDVPSAR
jgi:hypothetical protein